MSYQVIARKYRPQRFADVVGQEHVTKTLSQAIEQNRIAHAYLFCGPRGTGKTTVARIFAKCLNCTGGPKVEFDENDPRCVEIAEGRSIDVLEIDGASNNGVEQVRELRETCKYAPASSKFKIYIIDEVHMLSTAAFNALLKTLEEPPSHVKFMFATTDPEKVLPTILSRCQRFDLRRIPSALIVKQLAKVAKQEKVHAEDAALSAIARGADGGMRDAESALDQLISFCGDKIEENDVLSMFGLTAQGQLLQLSHAILNGEIHTALQELNDLAQKGKDLGRLLSDLLNHFRNLLLYQVSKGDLDMLEVSETETASLKEQTSLATTDSLTRILEVLADAELKLRDAASKKILLEITLLKAIEARNTISLDAVLKQLNALRSGGNAEAVITAPAVAVAAPGAKPPARSATVVANVEQLPAEKPVAHSTPTAHTISETPAVSTPAPAGLEELWTRLIEAVARVSPFVRTYLLEAHPVSLEKGLMTIGFDPEFEDHMGLVDNARNHTLLQTKLSELGHPHTQIKFIKAETPANRTPVTLPPPIPAAKAASPAASTTAPAPAKEKSPATSFSKEDFKNDPLIQKALEVFKGQIVEVRA
jgi:DNA polymerase-3 subunit gamma/tau